MPIGLFFFAWLLTDLALLRPFELRVHLLEKTSKTKLILISLSGVDALVWHVLWCSIFCVVAISHPALLLNVLPYNVQNNLWANLLPSLIATENVSLEVFSRLKKWLYCLFGFFGIFRGVSDYILFNSGSWHLMGYKYHWFGLHKKHTLFLIFWNSAKIDMLSPSAIKTYLFFWPIRVQLSFV